MRPAVLPLVTRHASEWFGGGDDTLRYGCPPPNWIHPENVAGQAALNVRHAVTGVRMAWRGRCDLDPGLITCWRRM